MRLQLTTCAPRPRWSWPLSACWHCPPPPPPTSGQCPSHPRSPRAWSRLQSLRGPELSPLPRQDPDRLAGALCAPISIPGSLSLDFTSLSRIQVWVPCPTRFLSLAAVILQPKPCSRLGSWPDTPSTPCPCRSKCGLGLPCPLRILSLCPVCPHPGLGPATLLA